MGLGLVIFTTSSTLNATYTFNGTVTTGAAVPQAQVFLVSTFGSVIIAIIVAWAAVFLGAGTLVY